MSSILSGALVLLAGLILLAIVGLFGIWLKGSTSIIFPGLGLVVATPLLLLLLVITEAVLLYLIFWLSRG